MKELIALELKIISESAQESLKEIQNVEDELSRLYMTKGVLNSVLAQIEKVRVLHGQTRDDEWRIV